jgi:hypothetical protein
MSIDLTFSRKKNRRRGRKRLIRRWRSTRAPRNTLKSMGSNK